MPFRNISTTKRFPGIKLERAKEFFFFARDALTHFVTFSLPPSASFCGSHAYTHVIYLSPVLLPLFSKELSCAKSAPRTRKKEKKKTPPVRIFLSPPPPFVGKKEIPKKCCFFSKSIIHFFSCNMQHVI